MLQVNHDLTDETDDTEETFRVKHADGHLWSVRIVDTLSEMEKIKSLWQDLEENCHDPLAVFQNFAWCKSWAKHYIGQNKKAELRIFCAFADDDLSIVIPMMITSHLGIKILTLLGEPHSQIANCLFDSIKNCEPGLNLCLKKIYAQTDVDIIALGPIPKGSLFSSALDSQFVSNDPAQHLSHVSWTAQTTTAGYLASLKKNRRKDFGKKLRRLELKGEVRFVRYGSNSKNFEFHIEEAIAWKLDWIKRNNVISIGLSYPDIAAFLKGCHSDEGDYGLEVEALELDGKPIAICINLIGKGIRNCFLSAYDPAYADVSPGTLIHQHAIQASIEDGYVAYSFLGFPTPFKDMWTNQSEPLVRYQKPITLRGRLWVSLWTNLLRPAVKRILSATKSGFARFLIKPVAKALDFKSLQKR